MKKVSIITVCMATGMLAFADSVSFREANMQSSQFSRDTQIAGQAELVASGGISPIGISLVPPVQFPPRDWDIYGVRLNIFVGAGRDVGFIDVGVLGNIVDGNLSGIEIAGLYNRIGSSDGAIQAACIMNYSKHDFCGVQLGLVNSVDGDMQGLQAGAVNLAQDGAGVQLGVFNRAERFSGLQIGFANYAYQLEGVQIGVFNVIEDSNIPFMPIVNAAF